MISEKPPLIIVGQVYLHEELDQYIVVTKNNRGEITWRNKTTCGMAEDEEFVKAYLPVDPEDLSDEESAELIVHLNPGQPLLMGFTGYGGEEEEIIIEEEEFQ